MGRDLWAGLGLELGSGFAAAGLGLAWAWACAWGCACGEVFWRGGGTGPGTFMGEAGGIGFSSRFLNICVTPEFQPVSREGSKSLIGWYGGGMERRGHVGGAERGNVVDGAERVGKEKGDEELI